MVVVKMTTREAMTADDSEARMWWWWRWRQSLRRWQQMTRRQGRLQLMGFSSTRLTRLRAAPPDNSFEHHVCAGGNSTVPRCSIQPLLILSMLRIFWMFTCTTFLRQRVLPLIDNQVHFTSDCLASLSNLDDLVQTYLSYTKYTFWLLSASVHCKSWTAAYEASTGPHEYSSVTVSSYLLLTSLYNIRITHNTPIMCNASAWTQGIANLVLGSRTCIE